MTRFIVIEPFEAEAEGEITLIEGAIVTVVEQCEDGWVMVQTDDGRQGFFPGTYLEALPDVNRPLPPVVDPNRALPPPPPGAAATTTSATLSTPTASGASSADALASGRLFSKVIKPKLSDAAAKQPGAAATTPSSSSSSVTSTASPASATSSTAPKPMLQVPPVGGSTSAVAPASSGGGGSSSGAAPLPVISPRGESGTSTTSSGVATVVLKPTVVRVHHCEDVHRVLEERDLKESRVLTPFKSIMATNDTPTRSVVDSIARKMLLADASPFRLYMVDLKAQTMQLLPDDEKPVLLMKNVFSDSHMFAFIYSPHVKASKRALLWAPEPGGLMHRRLMQDHLFSKYSDLTVIAEGNEFHSFQAVIDIRLSGITRGTTDLVKKRKERKILVGTHMTVEMVASVSFDLLLFAFDWAYTGKVDFVMLNLESTFKLVNLAQALGATLLQQTCETWLKNGLDFHNIFPFLSLAHSHNNPRMKQFAIDFCMHNWATVMSNKDGLSIIGIELFQELTLANVNAQRPPPYEQTPLPDSQLSQHFMQMLEQRHQTDAVAVFGTETVPFHRFVLAAASDALHSFLNQVEPSTKKLPQYHFEGISAAAFKALLVLLYAWGNIDPLTAVELLEHTLVPFELHALRDRLEQNIARAPVVTMDTCLPLFRYTYLPMNAGRMHLTVTLRGACRNHIINNFAQVKIADFEKLPKECLYDLLHLLHMRFREQNIVLAPSQ